MIRNDPFFGCVVLLRGDAEVFPGRCFHPHLRVVICGGFVQNGWKLITWQTLDIREKVKYRNHARLRYYDYYDRGSPTTTTHHFPPGDCFGGGDSPRYPAPLHVQSRFPAATFRITGNIFLAKWTLISHPNLGGIFNSGGFLCNKVEILLVKCRTRGAK